MTMLAAFPGRTYRCAARACRGLMAPSSNRPIRVLERCRAFRRRAMLRVLCVLVVAVLGALPASAEKRVALIIGNSAYQQAGTLANPVNDAKEMAAALQDLGFVVLLGLDLDKRAFDIKV